MKRLLYFALFILILVSTTMTPQTLNLLPVPEKITLGEGNFVLTHSFDISIKGNPDKRIYPYATRVLRRLSGRTGLFFPQDFLTEKSIEDTADCIISVEQPGKVLLNEDESYSLQVFSNKILLKSKTDLGAMRGMETLLQLLQNDDSAYFLPVVSIDDKPRFPWRGLMIDACRHFMPVEVIKRNLDAMAAVKLNVFHWHLSEDQGFRVECKTFPKLHQLGSDGMFYTHAQIKEILAYAEDRGIRVIPEFDIPGHSTSWFVGYPELASAPGPYTIERRWGVFDPTFNPTIEETYKFFDAFFKEMCELFPDEYMHIGGDENNGKQWNQNEKIQAFMKENGIKSNHDLQTLFNKRISAILTKYGKKMIGWDEILQPELPKNIVIQSWRGTEALAKAAQQGYMGILSNGYYIDLIQPTDYHYLNDPVPADSKLSDDEKKFVLGGEATMWAEFVVPENVDSRIWPRTAAIAERFWSPQNVRDVDDMYRRLDRVNFQLEELGITNTKNQEMMLRRLTNNGDCTALNILVDVIEPVKIYTRHNYGVKYYSYSPYTRVVDAAVPDAPEARKFRKLVDEFLNGKKELKNKITAQLTLWRNNHEKLAKTINLSPIIKEIEPLSLNLKLLSEAGLETLSLLDKKQKPKEDWIKATDKLLLEAKKSYGQTELMIVSAVEKLVNEVKK
ncbi:MAG: beta-hexosaminidase [Ignavibacteria bacterium CG_4_8_14_3_um_filter_37_9]|nr:MAG: beta-hexosaminidase [Ignavibacteria bacterium CG_4_8_14_3_um_filter_37_9]